VTVTIADVAAHLQRIPRRVLIGAWIVIGLATTVALAPDAARNLVMLAWLRSWTQPNDDGLTSLAPVVQWLLSNERGDSYLQAQTAGMANSLGNTTDSTAALERARSLAPIARQCNSSDAMRLESLAQPLLPHSGTPKPFIFFAHSESRPEVSQMRTIAGSDGAANCLHVLTLAAPDGADEFGAMHATLPVQPGRRYQIDAECYVTGRIRVDFQADDTLQSSMPVRSAQNPIDKTRETRHRPPPSGAGDGVFRGYQLGFAHSMPVDVRDAWTTITLRFAADQQQLSHVQVIAREGSGRITCRNSMVSDITDASR
jgi:hypothetical protein